MLAPYESQAGSGNVWVSPPSRALSHGWGDTGTPVAFWEWGSEGVKMGGLHLSSGLR